MDKSTFLSEKEWIQKTFKSDNEIFNLNYLLSLAPDLIPALEIRSESVYFVEKCRTIEFEDISPKNVSTIYNNLFLHIYAFKHKRFTKGVYKYFGYNGLNSESISDSYVLDLMNSLESYIDLFHNKYPLLYEDKVFIDLVSRVRKDGEKFARWVPCDGYSLLHGDLHVGNIVKKRNKYLLIDFEFLQYGRPEIEIANLIISALIWNYENFSNKDEIKETVINYLDTYSKLPSIEGPLFKFFFYYVQILFYFKSIVKNDTRILDVIAVISKIETS